MEIWEYGVVRNGVCMFDPGGGCCTAGSDEGLGQGPGHQSRVSSLSHPPFHTPLMVLSSPLPVLRQ